MFWSEILKNTDRMLITGKEYRGIIKMSVMQLLENYSAITNIIF